jgi:DNA polymerase-3 subunit gamma/tau
VDNVRAIRDEVIYAPTKARRKVYIIDEVHMLSSGAFNALLKTLEEPPAHVLFILATTEPHKLPATILSRCQRFDFRRITHESIIRHLDKIASASGTTLEPDAAKLIARMSEGAMRDAISLLDQCISTGGGRIGYEDVLSVAGIVNDVFMTDFIRCMLEKNVSAMLSNIERLIMDGRDIAQFVSDLVLYFRNLLICKATNGQCDNLIEVPAAVLETMKKQADRISQDEIVYRVKELSALEASLKWASNPRVLLEVTLIRLNSMAAADGSVAERLAALESRLNSGNFAANPAAQAGAAGGAAPGGAAAQYGAAGGPGPVQGMDGRGIPAAAAGAGASPTSATSSVAAGGGSKAAPAAQSDIVEFKQWPKIMDHLKSLGRMKIHSFLLTAKAVVLDDNDIGLLFGPRESFTRTLVSKMEHLEMIEEAIVKITGREMKVKCLDEESFQRAPSKPKAAEDDELVAKARKIAEKAGLPLEIIDE